MTPIFDPAIFDSAIFDVGETVKTVADAITATDTTLRDKLLNIAETVQQLETFIRDKPLLSTADTVAATDQLLAHKTLTLFESLQTTLETVLTDKYMTEEEAIELFELLSRSKTLTETDEIVLEVLLAKLAMITEQDGIVLTDTLRTFGELLRLTYQRYYPLKVEHGEIQ